VGEGPACSATELGTTGWDAYALPVVEAQDDRRAVGRSTLVRAAARLAARHLATGSQHAAERLWGARRPRPLLCMSHLPPPLRPASHSCALSCFGIHLFCMTEHRLCQPAACCTLMARAP
jgi:hypothetical protein